MAALHIASIFHLLSVHACTAGEARWDVRMTAWLLYVRMVVAPQQTASGALWRAYLALLPPRHAAPCLLNYVPEAAVHLQVCVHAMHTCKSN